MTPASKQPRATAVAISRPTPAPLMVIWISALAFIVLTTAAAIVRLR